jgi:hypothetical protein
MYEDYLSGIKDEYRDIISLIKKKGKNYEKVEKYCIDNDINISKEIYEKALEINEKHLVGWNGLKKISKHVTKEENENGIEIFSIKNEKYSREFDSCIWKNMMLNDNIYYPIGYCEI